MFSRLTVLWLAVGLFAQLALAVTIQPVGCFVDSKNRLLNGLGKDHKHDFHHSYVKSKGMTPESCCQFCSGFEYKYCGVESGNQCFCGANLPASMNATTTCNTTCPKDPSNTCGGTWALQMYTITSPPQSPKLCTHCTISCEWCSVDHKFSIGCGLRQVICEAIGATGILEPLVPFCEVALALTCIFVKGASAISCKVAAKAHCDCSDRLKYCGP